MGLPATVCSLKTAFSYKKNLDDEISHFSNEFQDKKKVCQITVQYSVFKLSHKERHYLTFLRYCKNEVF